MFGSKWHPDVTVAAVCVKDDKYLIVEERSKSSGALVFNQPAGHIENDETILEAVIRETREETCRHFTPRFMIGLYRLPVNQDKTYIRYTFFGDISERDESLRLDPDILKTHWLTYQQIETSDRLRSGLVKTCIDDYLAGHHYPLELLREL